jgi:putative Ca2+/H+ antiporter (TMEM165/GDT1 family)
MDAFLLSSGVIFLAELGDKSQLMALGLRRPLPPRTVVAALATTEEPVGTWLGSTAGMVVADALAIWVGGLMGARMPERKIKVLAAAAFVVFGPLLLAEGLAIV